MSTLAPRENPALIGHEAAEAALAAAARAGRLHHAWLLTGPPGIGKATLAFRFARWLLAGMEDGPGLFVAESNPVFRRVASGGHADLLALSPNTGEKGKRQMIRVDEVRGLRGFMSLTPAEGGFRVLVLDEPETMDAAGQNAILKTLEEPPARAVLLLACSAPGRLLPTIRSRVRRLELQPLAEPVMAGWLAAAMPDMAGADRAMLARLSGGGSISREKVLLSTSSLIFPRTMSSANGLTSRCVSSSSASTKEDWPASRCRFSSRCRIY